MKTSNVCFSFRDKNHQIDEKFALSEWCEEWILNLLPERLALWQLSLGPPKGPLWASKWPQAPGILAEPGCTLNGETRMKSLPGQPS